MAANCVYIRNTEPVPAVNENLLSYDEGVRLEIESGNGYPGAGGCYYGEGKLYVTNRRLLFIKASPSPLFSSFGLPYCKLEEFKIKTPLFSSAYITGKTKPVANGGLLGDGTFKIMFPDPEIMRSVFRLAQPQLQEFQNTQDKEEYETIGTMCALPTHEIFQQQFPEQRHLVRENILPPISAQRPENSSIQRGDTFSSVVSSQALENNFHVATLEIPGNEPPSYQDAQFQPTIVDLPPQPNHFQPQQVPQYIQNSNLQSQFGQGAPQEYEPQIRQNLAQDFHEPQLQQNAEPINRMITSPPHHLISNAPQYGQPPDAVHPSEPRRQPQRQSSVAYVDNNNPDTLILTFD